MRISKGLFSDKRCLIQESSSEFAWECTVKGVVKECGDLYFYLVECEDGPSNKELYYIPREAVCFIKVLPEKTEKAPVNTVMDVLEVGTVLNTRKPNAVPVSIKKVPRDGA